MHGQPQRNPIANGPKDRAEQMPGDLPVWADLLHQFIQPNMGALQGLIKNIKASAAHAGFLPG
jgi:hypothetical protein